MTLNRQKFYENFISNSFRKCGSDFRFAYNRGENNINRYRTETPRNIDIWMLYKNKENYLILVQAQRLQT